MDRIPYEKLSEKLVEIVPELKSAYELECQQWGEDRPGPHIIFGDLLSPYLLGLLRSNKQENILFRIFSFLEQLANQEDTRVQEVVAFTILERLRSDKELLAYAQKYMGERTRRFCQELKEFWE
jgi:hypothetical protein